MISEEAFSIPSHIMRGTSVQRPNDPNPNPNQVVKRKRSLPGTPDPDAEVIALSPKSLMAKNRFVCEICKKGFQRDQNLQLHRRGHNLPWKLRQRTREEAVRKKVYVCPERGCVHNDPSRALGDLTGVKKHYSRKHGEKKWKCDKCSKKYAVQSDWKAHTKICGTRQYKCDCGTLFSRKDSFITHRAFCEALAEQSARMGASVHPAILSSSILGSGPEALMGINNVAEADHAGQNKMKQLPLWLDQADATDFVQQATNMFDGSSSQALPPWLSYRYTEASPFASDEHKLISMPQGEAMIKREQVEESDKGGYFLMSRSVSSLYSCVSQNQQQGIRGPSSTSCHHMSATALLQKATQMESTSRPPSFNGPALALDPLNLQHAGGSAGDWQGPEQLLYSGSRNEEQLGFTRDFLGVGDDGGYLANFNPMGSLINLQTHFAGHH